MSGPVRDIAHTDTHTERDTMSTLEKKLETKRGSAAVASAAKTVHTVDLAVIGAGSGGLSVASGAAQLGRSVVLFEAEEMGGDCLNYGCVPSKALIAAGKAAQAFREAERFGVENRDPKVNFDTVKAHVQGIIDTIAPHDSQERFEGLGVTVIRERGRFAGPTTVESDTYIVHAKRIVVATGSRASAPPVPGLDTVPYLTNETIFSVPEQPEHLIVIGAGPIGIELGQAFRRFGSEVTIVDISEPMGRAEPEHAAMVVEALEEEGVTFHAPARTARVRRTEGGVALDLEDGTTIEGSHILVAAGRAPVVDGLNLEAANVTYSKRGIDTDVNLRTSNPKVFAVGDVAAGRGGLTHAAGYHAGVIIKQFYFLPPILNRLFAKADATIPAAIYAEPELASVGLTEAEAREAGHDVRTSTADFSGNDRAIAERETHGAVKIVATPKGRILGASIVGENAGDLIQIVGLAMREGVKMSGLAQMIAPYPTRGEAVKRAAGAFYTDSIFSPKTRKLAGVLTRFH